MCVLQCYSLFWYQSSVIDKLDCLYGAVKIQQRRYWSRSKISIYQSWVHIISRWGGVDKVLCKCRGILKMADKKHPLIYWFGIFTFERKGNMCIVFNWDSYCSMKIYHPLCSPATIAKFVAHTTIERSACKSRGTDGDHSGYLLEGHPTFAHRGDIYSSVSYASDTRTAIYSNWSPTIRGRDIGIRHLICSLLSF